MQAFFKAFKKFFSKNFTKKGTYFSHEILGAAWLRKLAPKREYRTSAAYGSSYKNNTSDRSSDYVRQNKNFSLCVV